MARGKKQTGTDLVVAEVKELKTVSMPAINSKNETALVLFVNESLTHYRNGKLYAHMAACAAIAYAADANIGSPKLINLVYDRLGGFESKETTDAMLFRSWCGRITKVVGAGARAEDGTFGDAPWLGFRKKAESETKPAGFFVKSGDKFLEGRKSFDLTEAKRGLRFMDKVGGRGGVSPDLMAILEAIAGFKKRQDSRADKAEVVIPEEIEKMLGQLSVAATAEINKLSLTKPTAANIVTSQSTETVQ